jgi:hypothetical protein
MAERRPLVQIAGEVQELPSGDSLPGGGGGGTPNLWFAGSGSPGGAVNAVTTGDMYLDTSNGDVYQAAAPGNASWSTPITNIKGSNGTNGTDGTNGTTWFSQSIGTPTALDAGDFWLDPTTGDIKQSSAGGTGFWGSTIGNLKGPQGDPGTITIDAVNDAAADGAIAMGTYHQAWNWTSGVSQAFSLQLNSSNLFSVGYDGASFESYVSAIAQHVFIADASGKLSFFGQGGATRQTVSAASVGVSDGTIAALTFSSTPTQPECEALRDQCEYLRDWIEEVRTRLNELNFALDAYGLIENGL